MFSILSFPEEFLFEPNITHEVLTRKNVRMRAYSEVFCVRSQPVATGWTTIEIFSLANSFLKLFWRESVAVVLTFCPTTLCLATRESAIIAIDGSKMTSSTTLGLVTSLKMMMMMVVGVLNSAVAQSAPHHENLAIPTFFGLQDPVCYFDGSLISMDYKVLLVHQHIEDS